MENEQNCNCTGWPEATRDIVTVLAVAVVFIVIFAV